MVTYWRLSGFYLLFFASLGALIPYWGLYLKSLGFSPTEIGEVMAVIMATKIVAPNIWGWIADHSGRRVTVVRLTTLFAVLAFVGIFFGGSYWWLVVVMMLFSFFWNAALPQFEATTLSHLGEDVHRYSMIRLWGSVGFILTVVSLGPLLDAFGAGLLPGVIVVLLIALWLSTLLVPETKPKRASLSRESLGAVLKQPLVIALLLVCFLLQASHGPYYTFFTIYLEEHGYSRTLIGLLWAVGVLAEIGVFLVMHRLLPRFGARQLLLFSLAVTTVRWLLVALFVDSIAIMIAAQLLHAASFGIYHAVVIHLIHKLFVGRLQGRGQALYSSISFGAGGAVGSLLSGYLWVSSGASVTYLCAAIASASAFLIAWWAVRPDSSQSSAMYAKE